MRAYLKNPPVAEDPVITSMITAATEWGEKYTCREFRDNEWELLLDCFEDRIELNRSPVASIVSVEHLVSGSNVAVDGAVFYLKKGNFSSEILLNENQSWPTDTDNREQAITVTILTEKFRCGDLIKTAIERHVAFWFQNRGDCDSCEDAAKQSGVTTIYNTFKIPRV